MVLAASHVILGVITLFLIRKLSKINKFSKFSKKLALNFKPRAYLLTALGALIPDFDFLPALIFGNADIHRLYMNEFWIPFVIFGIGHLIFKKYRLEVFAFSIGYLTHILLDLFMADLLTLALLDGVIITVVTGILLLYYWKKNSFCLEKQEVNEEEEHKQ